VKEDDDEFSSDGSSDEEQSAQRTEQGESDAEVSDSDDEDEATTGRGADSLQARALDIPRVDDIPIVSKLAKEAEKEKLAQMDGAQQLEYQKQKRRDEVTKVIEDDAEELETHFVENPFIKMRERAS